MDDLEDRYLRLVDTNRGRLRRICRAYAPDAEAERDLYQEMLLQVWRSLPTFEGRSEPDTWLYRVALNTALRHRRDRSRHAESRGGRGPSGRSSGEPP